MGAKKWILKNLAPVPKDIISEKKLFVNFSLISPYRYVTLSCRRIKVMKLWTEKKVSERFRMAVLILEKYPFLKLRDEKNTWPLLFSPVKLESTPKKIIKCLETLTWLKWVEKEQRDILWMRANKEPYKIIYRKIGLNRMTTWRKWCGALNTIAKKLNLES